MLGGLRMESLNPQAEELNLTLRNHNSTVYELLSKRGKAIYYPAKGILAQGAAAKGKEINATIGTAYEDDGSPMVLPSMAGLLGIDPKDAFPYAPSEGLKPLRDKWKELIRAKNPSLDTHEISTPVVSCGVTNGLSITGYLFVDENDEIILSDLYWENYDLVFSNAYGGRLKFFNLFNNGAFDIDSFKQVLRSGRSGKKMVVLNFPNNPSGYTPTVEEGEKIIMALEESARSGNKLVVVLDDSYFGLVFENKVMTESLFARLARCHENILAVKADGLTKEEYAWGLRVGFLTYGIKNGTKELYKALEDKTAGAIRGNISNSSHISQSLFLRSINSEHYAEEKQRNKDKIAERYAKVKVVFQQHPEYKEYFEALPFNSGYFMCTRLKKSDPDKVWELLLSKYSTGVICYSEKALLRIAFASMPLGKIDKLFANIYLACKEVE
jgi:aspartate/methionine/tyrosine aminotransferase